MTEDYVLEEDLEFISSKIFQSGEFSNSTVLITGASGLLGALLVKSMLHANKSLGSNVRILANVRDIQKARDIFKDYLADKNLNFIVADLAKPVCLNESIDYIVHAASITASRQMVENPAGVLLTAFESTKNLLNYLKLNPDCKMVYISSMEYYGQIFEGVDDVSENNLGYLDFSNPRSCYPESKRVCEALCKAYAEQYKVNVCSARLAQTFGAGVPILDTRVFAQFARSAINGCDIVLHTSGESEGNYCYTADAVCAIFLLLKSGQAGHSYNVSCDHSTIFNMAKMVADKIASNKIQVQIKIPENLSAYGYAPVVKMKLNSDKLRALGWQPSTNLEKMFVRMIKSWETEKSCHI